MARLLALDIETTGLHWQKGDRIIEFCGQIWDIPTRKCLIDYTRRISNDGRRIDRDALAVHGISAADLAGAPLFGTVAPTIAAMLSKVDAVVTHNGEWFDLPFLAHELAGAGLRMPANLVSFDTMKLGMWASYDAKPPTLGELCWALGIDYDETKAHSASYDVAVMVSCLFEAADRGLVDLGVLAEAGTEAVAA